MEFSTSEGYLVYENVDILVKRNILSLLHDLNPRAEIVFLMKSSNVSEIRWFLDWSWKEYKLINTITLSFHETAGIKLFSYNPFISDRIKMFNLTYENVMIESQKMMSFNQERVWNLHHFPLKVHLNWKFCWIPSFLLSQRRSYK